MKIRSIIKCGLLLLGIGAATVSCEDMFTAENTLVTTDLAPQDTLYQLMGIVKRMQKLADRTILLGEVRADLVDVDGDHASVFIQELGSNNLSEGNIYNKPVDYYAVINSCNIYLSKVDSLRRSQGTLRFFEREICAVKCYRAWCYLELLKIYGAVPFLTTPVLTSDDAENIVASGQTAGAEEILSFLINDLMKYPYMDQNNDLRQTYGNPSFAGIRFSEMAIPVRALMGELYLWRGSYTKDSLDYVNAACMYHDYFNFPDEEIGTGSSVASWTRLTDDEPYTTPYLNNFNSVRQCAGVLAVDTSVYHGTVTDLKTVFNSHYNNNFYPAVKPSDCLKSLSKAQQYCRFYTDGLGRPSVEYGKNDGGKFVTWPELEGDLRLYSVCYGPSNVKDNSAHNREHAERSNTRFYNRKYGAAGREEDNVSHLPFIPFYRNNILYLHMAEALNRAGFSETAFAVLKYGLSYYILNKRDIISQNEFDKLCTIKSWGFNQQDTKYNTNTELLEKTQGSFVIWQYDVFGSPRLVDMKSTLIDRAVEGGDRVQKGIHSFGCGDVEYDSLYYYLDDEETKKGIPTYVAQEEHVKTGLRPFEWDYDTIEEYEQALAEYQAKVDYNKWVDSVNQARIDSVDSCREVYYLKPEIRLKRQTRVAQLILDEEALEGAFEGLRFYDLMRFQLQEGTAIAPGSTITMPAFMEEDREKYGTSKMKGKPWFLTLPKR